MNKLIFTHDCNIGIEIIDSQHQLLFAIANKLFSIQYPQEQNDKVLFLLEHLLNNMTIHFRTEEQILLKYDFPAYTKHKQEHAEILLQIQKALQCSDCMSKLLQNLDVLLNKWIKDHILTEDKAFSNWAKSTGLIKKK